MGKRSNRTDDKGPRQSAKKPISESKTIKATQKGKGWGKGEVFELGGKEKQPKRNTKGSFK